MLVLQGLVSHVVRIDKVAGRLSVMSPCNTFAANKILAINWPVFKHKLSRIQRLVFPGKHTTSRSQKTKTDRKSVV